MTVRELVAELKKIPGYYEVQVSLCELAPLDASYEKMDECLDNIVASCACLFSVEVNHEAKLAYIDGAALGPEDFEEISPAEPT
jgi:hypothetical protein